MNFKVLVTIFVLSLLLVGCLEEKKSAKYLPIGRIIAKRDNLSQVCRNYTQIKYVCPNLTTTTPTTSGIPQKGDNEISVKRCMLGKCVEAKISRDFDFVTSECEQDEDCYNIICYQRITTTSTTTTTLTSCEKACKKFDCPSETKYVGSKKTWYYYCCASKCAEKIKDTYLVCLKSDAEAVVRGFKKAPHVFCQ